MKESTLSNVEISHQKLSNNRQGFLLRQLLSLLECILKISFVAKLSDDVAIIGSVVDIVAFEDVWMIQFLQGLDLTLQHLLLWFSLDGPDVYYLDCYLFLGFVVGSTVDYRAKASAYDVLESIGVVLYLFTELVVAVELVLHSNSI